MVLLAAVLPFTTGPAVLPPAQHQAAQIIQERS